jgi:hypothetical protein
MDMSPNLWNNVNEVGGNAMRNNTVSHTNLVPPHPNNQNVFTNKNNPNLSAHNNMPHGPKCNHNDPNHKHNHKHPHLNMKKSWFNPSFILANIIILGFGFIFIYEFIAISKPYFWITALVIFCVLFALTYWSYLSTVWNEPGSVSKYYGMSP